MSMTGLRSEAGTPRSTGGRHETRGRRHSGFGRRSRKGFLRAARMAARCRFRRRQRLSRDPVHPARLCLLGHLRQERHRRGARLGAGPLSDRLRLGSRPRRAASRAASMSARCSTATTCTAARTRPICSGGAGSAVRIPSVRSYRSFASFSDPDGNGWLFQEITTRLPGRIDPATTTFASLRDLAAAIRRAEAAHGEHEKRTGGRDAELGGLVCRIHGPRAGR